MKKAILIVFFLASFASVSAATADMDEYELLLNESFVLNDEGRLEEAINNTQLIVKKYAKQSETYSRMRRYVANALALQGVIQSKQAILNNDPSKNIEAIASYDLLLKLYENFDDAELSDPIATVLIDKAKLLGSQQKYDLAIESYDRAIDKFKSNTDPSIQKQIAEAMIYKASINVDLKNFDEALNNFNSVFNYLGTPDVEALQEKIALAIYGKSIVFLKLNKLDDEIACYDEYIKYFHDDNTKVTESLQALLSKVEKQRNIALDTKKLIQQ